METSRSSPKPLGVVETLGKLELWEGGDGQGSKSREKKDFREEGELVGGAWSIVFESQLFPVLALFVAAAATPGKGGREALDLSQAARVAGSTGQTSDSESVFLDIFGWIEAR